MDTSELWLSEPGVSSVLTMIAGVCEPADADWLFDAARGLPLVVEPGLAERLVAVVRAGALRFVGSQLPALTVSCASGVFHVAELRRRAWATVEGDDVDVDVVVAGGRVHVVVGDADPFEVTGFDPVTGVASVPDGGLRQLSQREAAGCAAFAPGVWTTEVVSVGAVVAHHADRVAATLLQVAGGGVARLVRAAPNRIPPSRSPT